MDIYHKYNVIESEESRMQKAITLTHSGMILRGMEHFSNNASDETIPAVILFHGFTGTKLESHRLLLKISRKLERLGYACFRFDFLGSGESDGDFEDMTVSKEISEANSILDFVRNDPRIDESRVSVIGFSMGGLVASVLAGDRPDDIHKLLLMSPAGNMYDLIQHSMQTSNIDYEKATTYDHGGNLVGVEFVKDLKSIDVFERAKHFFKDVLLIHGIQDDVVPYEVSNRYQQECYGSKATIHFIDGANHTFDKFAWELEVIDTIESFFKNKS